MEGWQIRMVALFDPVLLFVPPDAARFIVAFSLLRLCRVLSVFRRRLESGRVSLRLSKDLSIFVSFDALFSHESKNISINKSLDEN